MPAPEAAIPYLVCVLCGAALALIELLQTFGKWLGRYWKNRYVAYLIALNAVTAAGVYAFARHFLGLESGLALAAFTGFTFPTILRTEFTYFRTLGGAQASDQSRLSIPVNTWYRGLEGLCYREVNCLIADSRAEELKLVCERLREVQVIRALEEHIASEIIEESRSAHEAQLEKIRSMADSDQRLVRLAALMIEILPQERVRKLLENAAK